MRLLSCLLGFALAAAGVTAQDKDKTGDYVKDGKLKERVEVLELQGGFAGFTGTYYTIEADGSWATGDVLPRDKRGEAKAKGTLTADQVKELAKAFAAHDLANLPTHGQPETNPKVTTVVFGKKKSELQPKAGDAKPEEDKAVRARYDGIVQAVKAVAKDKDAKKE